VWSFVAIFLFTFKVPPCYSMYENFILCSLLNNIPVYGYITTYSSVHQLMDICLHFTAIVNNVLMNINVQVFVCESLCFLSGKFNPFTFIILASSHIGICFCYLLLLFSTFIFHWIK
jgi:hypothetical protein